MEENPYKAPANIGRARRSPRGLWPNRYEWVVVAIIALTVAALLLPAIRTARHASKRAIRAEWPINEESESK